MKLSINEAKLTGLWARNCAIIQQVLILKFAFGPEKFPGLSRNEPIFAMQRVTPSLFLSLSLSLLSCSILGTFLKLSCLLFLNWDFLLLQGTNKVKENVRAEICEQCKYLYSTVRTAAMICHYSATKEIIYQLPCLYYPCINCTAIN